MPPLPAVRINQALLQVLGFGSAWGLCPKVVDRPAFKVN